MYALSDLTVQYICYVSVINYPPLIQPLKTKTAKKIFQKVSDLLCKKR